MVTTAGVDIGGTKIRWAVLKDGRVVFAREIKTPRAKVPFLSKLRVILSSLRRRGIRRAGIGFPGAVSGATFVSAHNLPFLKDINAAALAPRGLALRLDNDARCFARAESAIGAARRKRRVLVLAIGTGIGRGFAKNGEVARLPRFTHAEPWERAYQARLSRPVPEIARFLAGHLAPLVAEVAPDMIVLGGGMMRKPRFFSLLKGALRNAGIRASIRRSRFHQNVGAVGAALLFGE